MISDTLGYYGDNGYYAIKGYSQLLLLINPSVIDLQDTL